MAIKTVIRDGFVDSASDDNFTWKHFDGSNGETLYHIETGRKIYQMYWMTNGMMDEPVTGEVRDQALAFWAALKTATEPKVTTHESRQENTGLCPRCGTYCYGDCEASR